MNEFDKLITEMWQELSVRDFTVNDIDKYCAQLIKAHETVVLKTIESMNVKQFNALLKWQNEREELNKRIAELEAQLPKVVVPHKKWDSFPPKWVGHSCSCGESVRQGTKACSACGSRLDWTEVEK